MTWASYEELFNWVKEHSSSNELIASGLDTMSYLYTDRQSFRPFVANPASLFYNGDYSALGTVEDLVRILRAYRPKYLIHTPVPGYSEEKPFSLLLENLWKEYPKALNTLYIGSENRFRVFSVHLGSELE